MFKFIPLAVFACYLAPAADSTEIPKVGWRDDVAESAFVIQETGKGMRRVDVVAYGNLTRSQTQLVNVTLDSTTTFNFYTTSGTAVCYASSTVSSPDASNNEFLLNADEPSVVCTHKYSVDENNTLLHFLVEGTSSDVAAFYLEIENSDLPDTDDEESNKTTTTKSPKTQTPKNKPQKLSSEEIAGIAVGCVAIVVVIVILILLWKRKKDPVEPAPENPRTKAQAAIMEVQQTQIHEIRHYSRPPAGVQEIMTAVYLLLGYESNELAQWHNIQRLLGEQGKKNIRRRVLEVDPRNITIQQAKKSKEQLRSLDQETVQKISVGLTLFYEFVICMIEEVEKMQADENYSPNRFAMGGKVFYKTTIPGGNVETFA